MNTRLRQKAKNNFEKDLFKLINNTVFRKKIVRKRRNIKLVTKKMTRNHFVSEPNKNTARFSKENLLAIEIGKPQLLRNKCFHLG